ncbi:MAG: S8 family serine peptidase [Sporichthyaceae bacterium]
MSADAVDPERYIVTYTEASTDEEISASRERAEGLGAQIVYEYTDTIRGFAAVLTTEARTELAADPAVGAITADEVVRLSVAQTASTAAQSTNLNASLDRIDQRSSDLDGLFRQRATGAGVRAYVVDTGIANHDEFGSRLKAGFDIEGRSSRGRFDCEGHGTHVAGSLGGRIVGVAKQVDLVPVRVFQCSGSTGVSSVIAGLDWGVRDFKQRDQPAVMNLSLSIGNSPELDKAVGRVIAAGLPVVTAAGNDAGDACAISPARVSSAITVGAVTVADELASFSNSGDCVDIFAPGVRIRSADAGDSNGYRDLDGTSMAAPHVSGTIAAFLQHTPDATPGEAHKVLLDASTHGVVTGPLRGGTPNRLLYSLLPIGNRAPKVSTPSVSLPGAGGEIRTDQVPVKLRWSGSDPDGHKIDEYRIQRSYDGGQNWSTVETVDGRTESVKVWVRPDSKLRFRVRATDDQGKSGSNAHTATMRLALLQEGAAELRSSWKRKSGSKLSGGAERVAGRKGASLTLSFTGSRIRWIGSMDRDRGRAKVYLDGKLVATVDSYADERAVRRVLFGDSVKPGRHTLRIVLTGSERSKATDSRVAADAFVVLD